MTEEQKKLKAERDRRYREKKKAQKALEELDRQMPREEQETVCNALMRQVPGPIVVEGNPDDLPPVEIPAETLTYFDVYKRRHEEMFK